MKNIFVLILFSLLLINFSDRKSMGYNTIEPFDWTWFNISAGGHDISAEATDNNGAKIYSRPVRIHVIQNM